MKLFGKCHTCESCIIGLSGLGCLVGHGENDYRKITFKEAKEIWLTYKVLSEFQITNLLNLFPLLSKLKRPKIITLPSFLYEDDEGIKIGRRDDSIITEEWNNWILEYNKEHNIIPKN